MKNQLVIDILRVDDLSKLEQLIKTGFDPKLPCESFGRNVLHIAAKMGSIKCLNYILENNLVPLESEDHLGNTALISAATVGEVRSIEVLGRFNVNLNHKNKKDKSPAQMALDAEQINVVDLIEKMGGDVTALEDYIEKNNLDVAKMRENQNAQLKGGGKVDESILGANNTAKVITATQEDLKKYPGFTNEQIVKVKELVALGFENITDYVIANGAAIGREVESKEIVDLVSKNNNVIIVGEDGIGKTTMMQEVAKNLLEEGVVLLQVPSNLLRGNKYAGSVNENIQKWIKTATEIYPKAVLFVDEIHNLTTGKTTNDTADTPTQILKGYLDNIGEARIQMIGATTPKEYDKLKEADESFLAKFVNGTSGGYKLRDLSKDDILKILMNEKTISFLQKEGLAINDMEKYKELVERSVDLLDKHIFNQKFPYKAFDFIKTVLSFNSLEEITKEKLEQEFSRKYNVPIELINGYVDSSSVYLNLENSLKEKLLGQNEVIETMATAIIRDVAFKSHSTRKPLSFLSLGPTGVGKSEAVEVLEGVLGTPKIEFKMGEFKSAGDMNRIVEQLSEFISKNYSGVIVFDEIEKANPQILDVLLGLLDKGRIGSGKNEVRCGNQIFIATSNIGSDITSRTKKELRDKFGTTGLPEDFLRDILIESGMRPEIVNRFSKILDFNPIYLDVALEIGKKMFFKKQRDTLKEKGIEIIIEDSFIKTQIEKDFNEENNRKNGARGIERIVESSFEKILGDKEVLLRARPGTKIIVSESQNGDEIVLNIESQNGEKYVHQIKEDGLSKEEKLKQVIASMQKNIEEASGLLSSVSIKPDKLKIV